MAKPKLFVSAATPRLSLQVLLDPTTDKVVVTALHDHPHQHARLRYHFDLQTAESLRTELNLVIELGRAIEKAKQGGGNGAG